VDNVVLIGVLKTFPSDLHDEELNQIGEVHLKKVILLKIFKLGADR
jgi:hypothetical protein